MRNFYESHLFMQRHARRIGQGDAADETVQLYFAQLADKRRVKHFTETSPGCVWIEINGDFDRKAVSAAAFPLARIGKADDGAIFLDNKPRQRRRCLAEANPHLVNGDQLFLECDDGVGDVVVVDGAD